MDEEKWAIYLVMIPDTEDAFVALLDTMLVENPAVVDQGLDYMEAATRLQEAWLNV